MDTKTKREFNTDTKHKCKRNKYKSKINVNRIVFVKGYKYEDLNMNANTYTTENVNKFHILCEINIFTFRIFKYNQLWTLTNICCGYKSI